MSHNYPAESLDAYWTEALAARAASLDTPTLAAEHAAVCAEFEEAMREGLALPGSAWRRLGVLQAEHGRRVGPAAPPPSSPPSRLISYEVSAGDGPSSLPIRLGTPVLCF